MEPDTSPIRGENIAGTSAAKHPITSDEIEGTAPKKLVGYYTQ